MKKYLSILFSLVLLLTFVVGGGKEVFAQTQNSLSLNSCGNVTNPGTYSLTQNLISTNGVCLQIINAKDITINCQGKQINGAPSFKIENSENIKFESCIFDSTISSFASANNVSKSKNITFKKNTFNSKQIDDTYKIRISSSYDSSFLENTFTGEYEQYSSKNIIIKDNKFFFPKTNKLIAGVVSLVHSTGSQVTNNFIDGNSDTRQTTFGVDDGIYILGENGGTFSNNNIKNIWDCGIETSYPVSNSKFENNIIKNAGVCGIGGWYTNSLTNNVFKNNIVDDSPQALLFSRSYGLNEWYDETIGQMTRETKVYFNNNIFSGNTLVNPRNSTYSSTFMMEPILNVSIAGQKIITANDIVTSNNVFTNNNFGTGYAPFFSKTLSATDGGGNVCNQPGTHAYYEPIYPIKCQSAGFVVTSCPTGTTGTYPNCVTSPVSTPSPTVTFTANPVSVSSGGSTNLTWTTTNATSCTAGGGWTGTKSLNGSQIISNLQSTGTYTLTCSNQVGEKVTKSVEVGVLSNPIVSCPVGTSGTYPNCIKNTDPVDPTPTSSCVDLSTDLKFGDKNSDVNKLQSFLQSKGFFTENPTGYFGPITLQAVKDFQKANNIFPAEGFVGPVTRAKIKTLTCGDLSGPICDYAAPPTDCKYVQGPNYNSNTQCGLVLQCVDDVKVCPTGTTGIYPICIKNTDPVDPTPTSSCVDLSTDLKSGDKNDEVTKLQSFLKSKGYFTENTTGYFGTVTEQAVIAFQKANNITPAVGIVGPLTRAKIKELTCGDLSGSICDYAEPQEGCNYVKGPNYNSLNQCGRVLQCVNDVKVCPTGTTGIYPNCVVTNSKSTITVLSPNGGETWKVGDTAKITWSTLNAPKNSWVALFLENSSKQSQLLTQKLPVNGSYSHLIDDYFCSGDVCYSEKVDGDYKIIARLYTGSQELCGGLCYFAPGTRIEPVLITEDSSDNAFKISSEIILDPVCPTGQTGTYPNCVTTVTQKPTVTLTATPQGVEYGKNTTLTWTSTNTTSCLATGNWDGSKATSGSQIISYITGSKTYTLTCTGLDGTTVKTEVNVYIVYPAPVSTITVVSPNGGEVFNPGQSIEVKWESENISNLANVKVTIFEIGVLGGFPKTLFESTLNDGVETFVIPSTGFGIGNSFKVNVSVSTGVIDSSNNYFSIIPSSINSCPTGTTGTYPNCVTTVTPKPTVTLTANPDSLENNKSTTLTWSSTNATSCTASASPSTTSWGGTISNGWTGAKATSGSQIISNLQTTTTFTLTCVGSTGDKVSKSVDVGVYVVDVFPNPVCPTGTTGTYPNCIQPSVPTLTFTSNPSGVESGKSSTLTWTSTNATSCLATGGWTGTKATNGSQVISNITGPTTYTLTCTGPGGGTIAQTEVNVYIVDPAPVCPTGTTGTYPNCVITVTPISTKPTISITANPTPVVSGGSTTLTWTTTNMSNCKSYSYPSYSNWLDGVSRNTSGSQIVSNLTNFSSFFIECSSSEGIKNASVSITTTSPTPTTPTTSPYFDGCTSYKGYSATTGRLCYINDAGIEITPYVALLSSGQAYFKTLKGIWYKYPQIQTNTDTTNTSNLVNLCNKFYSGATRVSLGGIREIDGNKDVPIYQCWDAKHVSLVLGASTEKNPNLCSLDSTLLKGMKSPQVKCLQQKLNQKGYKVVGTEGGKEHTQFGYNTLLALKKFQAENSLKSDGILGLQTRALLNK